MSWKPQIEVDGTWNQNNLAFQTEDEARSSAKRTFQNWSLATGYRAVESTQEPNYAWRNGEMVAIASKEKK